MAARIMVIEALCHTHEADELFDGPISRSMGHRPEKEDWLFGAIGIDSDRPFVELAPATILRVVRKIVAGLAHKTGSKSVIGDAVVTLEEIDGRGDHADWAPGFSLSKRGSRWEL